MSPPSSVVASTAPITTPESLAEDLANLVCIQQDMLRLVETQAGCIETIADNLEHTRSKLDSGTDQLQQASQLQSHRTRWILGSALGGIIGLCLTPVATPLIIIPVGLAGGLWVSTKF